MRSLFLSFCLLFSGTSFAQSWDTVFVGYGVKPQMILRGGDVPYITSISEVFPQGYTVVHTWSQSHSFVPDTVRKGYFFGPAFIATDKNNTPYVYFHGHDVNDGDLTINHKNGSSWVNKEVHSDGHDGWDGAIVFDQDNHAHAISIDLPNGIEYEEHNGTKWKPEEIIGSGPLAYTLGTDFYMDENDTPHILYCDSYQKKLRYVTEISGGWNFTDVDSSDYLVMDCDFIVDEDGHFHSVYIFESQTADSAIVKYSHFDGNEWSSEVIDTLIHFPVGYGYGNRAVNIAFRNNELVVAYMDTACLKLASRNLSGGNWTLDTLLNAEPGDPFGTTVDMRIGSDDHYHMVFYKLSGRVLYLSDNEVTTSSLSRSVLIPNYYPVPASNELILETTSSFVSMEIVDTKGLVLFTPEFFQEGNKIRVNVSGCLPGVYFLRLKNEEGETQIRFIKK